MFTGIISEMGTVISLEKKGLLFRLLVSTKKSTSKIKRGASIAVNGVCLTVTEKKEKVLVFDILAETASKTMLSKLVSGDSVHLERALRVGDEMGGHFVSGHVDCVGTVVSNERLDEKQSSDRLLSVSIPASFLKYISLHGSVCISGVSLTVAKKTKKHFTVALIPFTQKQTFLNILKKGDEVNVECDMILKFYS